MCAKNAFAVVFVVEFLDTEVVVAEKEYKSAVPSDLVDSIVLVVVGKVKVPVHSLLMSVRSHFVVANSDLLEVVAYFSLSRYFDTMMFGILLSDQSYRLLVQLPPVQLHRINLGR